MKTIEVLDTFFADGQRFHEGEIRKVSAERAGRYCACGWARDISGEIPTAAPDTTPKTLDVENVVVDHTAQEPR